MKDAFKPYSIILALKQTLFYESAIKLTSFYKRSIKTKKICERGIEINLKTQIIYICIFFL